MKTITINNMFTKIATLFRQGKCTHIIIKYSKTHNRKDIIGNNYNII